MEQHIWQSKIETLVETAKLLLNRNVIDLPLIDGRVLEVYVAISSEERAIGLNNISYIDLDGMLFVYQMPSYTPFTVAKMQMDLDVAWYRQDGSLIKRGTWKAGSTEALYAPEPYSYVLEAESGTLDDTPLKISVKKD
jgi:uncharacterized membrane protein (UPF0127 family)